MAPGSVFLAWLDEDAVHEVRHDAKVFEACLAEARTRAAGPVEGFFGPDSQMWRMLGETAVSLGGMRAVLMQLAHPAIAAAGLQSSNFREDFIGRAWRTFATMSQLVFGELDGAAEACRRLHVLHARTRGAIPASASPSRAGEPYRGSDPALLLWVLATLYEGSTFTFERLAAPLDEAARRRYWDDMRLLGLLVGIPDDHMPPTLEDFRTYWDAMVEHELEAGPAAHELAAFLVHSPLDHVPPWLRRDPVARLAAAWTAGSAPPEWAHALGVSGGGRPRRDFERLTVAVRAAMTAVPSALRRTPGYHQASVRVARANCRPPTRTARAVARVSGSVRLPMGLEPLKALDGDEQQVLVDLFGQG